MASEISMLGHLSPEVFLVLNSFHSYSAVHPGLFHQRLPCLSVSTKMKSLPSSPLLVQGNASTFPEVCSPGLTTGALSSPFIVLSNSWPQSDSVQWLVTLSGHPRQRAHFRASTTGRLLEAPLSFACLGPE